MGLQCVSITKDPTIRQVIAELAFPEGWSAAIFDEPSHFFSAHLESVDLLVLDEAVTGPNYTALIKKVRKHYPSCGALVVGGPKSVQLIEKERREGVDSYCARPVETKALASALRHRVELAHFKAKASIIGRSPQLEEVIATLVLVAPTEVPILLHGESGTGKDVIARAVHLFSQRSSKPFEAINCASLAEGVLESELFGHEKGSFTGAVARRPGLFERADGGTVFLDEVGEMSANMQVRLLRALESGEVLRVGGIKTLKVDVRVVSATNRNLGEEVRKGSFRQDLYYRLKGVSLFLPPLRERSEDIPLLVDHFILQANKKHGKKVKGVTAGALRKLTAYHWPGNVRELKNAVDTMVVLSAGDRIDEASVEAQLRESASQGETPMLPVVAHRTKAEAEREMIYASILALHRDVREILTLLHEGHHPAWRGMKEVRAEHPADQARVQTLAQMERSAIQDALRATGGNRRKAADLLGISERTLYRKIKEYGLV